MKWNGMDEYFGLISWFFYHNNVSSYNKKKITLDPNLNLWWSWSWWLAIILIVVGVVVVKTWLKRHFHFLVDNGDNNNNDNNNRIRISWWWLPVYIYVRMDNVFFLLPRFLRCFTAYIERPSSSMFENSRTFVLLFCYHHHRYSGFSFYNFFYGFCCSVVVVVVVNFPFSSNEMTVIHNCFIMSVLCVYGSWIHTLWILYVWGTLLCNMAELQTIFLFTV